jgi:hypothetical protein
MSGEHFLFFLAKNHPEPVTYVLNRRRMGFNSQPPDPVPNPATNIVVGGFAELADHFGA